MKQYLNGLLAVVGILLLPAACGSGKDGGQLSPEKMKVVLWDMLRADEIAMSDNMKDTVRVNFLLHSVNAYSQVLAIHHITKDQFYNSYKYYQERPDKHKALFDSVLALGNRIKANDERKDSIRTAHQQKLDSVKNAAKADSIAKKKDTTVVKKDTLKKPDPKAALPPRRDKEALRRAFRPKPMQQVKPQ